MDMTSRGEWMLEVAEIHADVVQKPAVVAPKVSRRRTLTQIDKSGRMGRRIGELVRMFNEASSGAASPLRRLKIQSAAELLAVAEMARGALIRGESGNLSEVTAAENRAASACRAIGISIF
jgi:hypothetical protein